MGDKNICAIGLALMASGGCVMGLSDSYGVAFGGRLASGMGATLFNLVLAKMATDWFARREIVLAMAVVLSTWPFGIALGLFVEPRIAVAFGWRSVMLLAGVICLVSLLLVALFYRVPPAETEVASHAQGASVPQWRTLAPVVVAGIMWGSFNAGLVTYFSFVPSFLAAGGGLSMASAGALTSIALWVGMMSIPFGGFVVQRLGRPFATIIVFCALAAASLVLIVAGMSPFLACILFGLAIGPPPGVITSLPARVLAPTERAIGFGVFYTCHFLLQASGPAIGGWIHDTRGGAASVLFGSVLFLVPLPMLALFRFLTVRLQGGRVAVGAPAAPRGG